MPAVGRRFVAKLQMMVWAMICILGIAGTREMATLELSLQRRCYLVFCIAAALGMAIAIARDLRVDKKYISRRENSGYRPALITVIASWMIMPFLFFGLLYGVWLSRDKPTFEMWWIVARWLFLMGLFRQLYAMVALRARYSGRMNRR